MKKYIHIYKDKNIVYYIVIYGDFMLKKITFIDYKKEVYKIFIEQDNLYYSVKDEIIMLGEYVKDYCVKYFN